MPGANQRARLRHNVQGEVNNSFTIGRTGIGNRRAGENSLRSGLAESASPRDAGAAAYSAVPREIAIEASVLVRLHT
jgi:hypothetical protein